MEIPIFGYFGMVVDIVFFECWLTRVITVFNFFIIADIQSTCDKGMHTSHFLIVTPREFLPQ